MRIRDRELERRQARIQGTVLGLLATAVLGAALRATQAPADADELRIVVGELRSQAAELELIEVEKSRGKLAPAFVREHVRQLANINRTSFRELARLRVEQNLEAEKFAALVDGRELVARMSALGSGHSIGAPAELRGIRQRLQDRESALRP